MMNELKALVVVGLAVALEVGFLLTLAIPPAEVLAAHRAAARPSQVAEVVAPAPAPAVARPARS